MCRRCTSRVGESDKRQALAAGWGSAGQACGCAGQGVRGHGSRGGDVVVCPLADRGAAWRPAPDLVTGVTPHPYLRAARNVAGNSS